MRGKRKQFLLGTRIGCASFAEWQIWRTEQIDGLPDATCLRDELDEKDTPTATLISGILSEGEKMLIAGPSKAGKSFALMEMCVAFATGGEWFGFKCAKTDVLYINLELKKESRIRRMRKIYQAVSPDLDGSKRIHCMDLRGKSTTLEKMAGKIVKQAITTKCKVIIIDPIYKVMAGDENSSEDVAKFCGALDYLIERLGVSVVYCHHYSKGASSYSSAMNRASGSSVFSRDADALISLDEIELDEDVRKARFNELACEVCVDYLDNFVPGFEDRLEQQDDIYSLSRISGACLCFLDYSMWERLTEELDELEAACMGPMSAWRLEGTLRDFPRFAPVYAWYQWPIHVVDDKGVLKDAWEASKAKVIHPFKAKALKPGTKDGAKVKIPKKKKASELEAAYSVVFADKGAVTVGSLAEEMGISRQTVYTRIDRSEVFDRTPDGNVTWIRPVIEDG
jgi:hypothetical protein